MKDKEIIEDLQKSRNLKTETLQLYEITIKEYSRQQGKTFHELLLEAEEEEDKGVRWKHRTLKKRLINFRAYLYENYASNTAKTRITRILSLYKHFDIEIHKLPPYNQKNINKPHISYTDLPDKKIIKKAVEIANSKVRAIILFISSSGCARQETLNLTIGDFIEGTKEYHDCEDIYSVLDVLSKRNDVIPTFHIKRQKTNKYYYTFCSPEATYEIVNYLKSSKYQLRSDMPLFKTNKMNFYRLFQDINDQLQLGKVGYNNRFRSHMLRKFHASQLYNDGLSMDVVDSLQGRGKDSTHSAYFMENPERLKEQYVEHLDSVVINWRVTNITFKSKDFMELESENNKLRESYDSLVGEIMERVKSLENAPLNRNHVDNLKEKYCN